MIDCFIVSNNTENIDSVINQIRDSALIKSVHVICESERSIKNAEITVVDSLFSVETIDQISKKCEADYVLISLAGDSLKVGQFSFERICQVAENTNASMVYSGYFEKKNNLEHSHPVINYQAGSLRDDFDFGPVQLYKKEVLKSFDEQNLKWAGIYALRLHASRLGDLVHIPELLFTKEEKDVRKSGEKQFDYVSGSAREKQIEMEKVCTNHLRKIGAFLEPEFNEVDFSENEFSFEASVIIPVRNRIKTIDDAIKSVLNQKTEFSFNLIVVDNHSSDGTSELLEKYKKQGKLIHIIPDRNDLGIGGCWNEAVIDSRCGKFAVQLDSDDIYSDENTLQKIIDKFYEARCAMVIGSYQMTNFDLEEIPPGIIRHDEWTDDNGPNNALRINGLGAPRAFYTPILREIKIPNVSYGEDYAVGLAISRNWKIGRIYDPLYLCRRWDDNTDASLDINKLNTHNHYKDWVRTVELMARIKK